MFYLGGVLRSAGAAGERGSIAQSDNYPGVLDAAVDFATAARERDLTLDAAILALRAAWE